MPAEAPDPDWRAEIDRVEAQIAQENSDPDTGRWLTSVLAATGILGAITEDTPYQSIVLGLIILLNGGTALSHWWRRRQAVRRALGRR